ncbi:MAG: RNA polymerase sporulation sigma factor SigF [Thermoanaerobacteraceae bacterium]|nr:RNA polymerase sporulation sigma factor SigF [Thermoanaerobacteraceae bacterium]
MFNKDFERNGDSFDLIKKSQNGDKIALEKLLIDNSGLVWSIVKKFSNRGYEAEDLYQIGCIGFVKAIYKFDMSYNVKLTTYAVPIILGEIKRFIRDDGLIKVSRSLKELSNKAYFEKERLEKVLNREPSIQEIANELDVSAEDIAMAFESRSATEYLFDNPQHNDGDNISLIDKISTNDNNEYCIEDKLALRMILQKLKSRERQIIILRYFKEMTQTEVAKLLKISQVQVSRIEKKVLQKIKSQLT